MKDHQAIRRDYLLEIARRLRGPEAGSIITRAGALIAKWEASSSVHPRYASNWRLILSKGADAVEELAQSETPEALELQHCMPFAGILSNRDRTNLRDKH